MDEKTNNVNLGGGGRIACLLKRLSPFEFTTLKGWPKFPWAVVVAILVYYQLSIGFTHSTAFLTNKLINNSKRKEVADAVRFLVQENSRQPHKPQCLIMGTSKLAAGLDTHLLEKKLSMPVSKATINGSNLSESYAFLKKHENECKHVRLLFLTVDPECFDLRIFDIRKTRLRIMQEFGKRSPLAPGLPRQSVIDSMLPLRTSLTQIESNLQPHSLFKDICRSRPPISDPSRGNIIALYEKHVATRKAKKTTVPICSSEAMSITLDMVQYCKEKGIHLVLLIAPTWRGFNNFPEQSSIARRDQDFLGFINHLHANSNCTVVVARHFEDILPNINPGDCFFDAIHMSDKGATIYTNWLADQMLADPKIVKALNTPRVPEPNLLVKCYKKSRSILAGMYHRVKKDTQFLRGTPEVQVASPPQETKMR